MTTTELWLVASPSYRDWLAPVGAGLAAAGLAHQELAGPQAPALVRDLAAERAARPAALLFLGGVEEPQAEALNRACWAAGLTLLALGAAGGRLLLGPAVMPGAGACLACYRTYRSFFLLDGPAGAARPVEPPDAAQVAWLVGQIAGLLRGADGLLGQGQVARRAADGGLAWFRPFKDPLCPVCSPMRRYPVEVIQAFQYHAGAAHEDAAGAQRS